MDNDPWRQWQAFAAMFAPRGVPSSAFAGAATSTFAPQAEAAERFYAELRRFLSAGTGSDGPLTAEAARGLSDMLRERFAEYFPHFAQAEFGGGMAGMPPLYGTDAPALGPMREHQLRWQRMLDAWGRMSAAQQRLQRLCSDALREAAETFAERLRSSATRGTDARALHELYDEWINCAEAAYARAANGEPFCSALSDLVNAGSEWRQGMQKDSEQWAKFLDLPTRSELNAVLWRLQAVEERQRAGSAETPQRRSRGSSGRQPGRRGKAKR